MVTIHTSAKTNVKDLVCCWDVCFSYKTYKEKMLFVCDKFFTGSLLITWAQLICSWLASFNLYFTRFFIRLKSMPILYLKTLHVFFVHLMTKLIHIIEQEWISNLESFVGKSMHFARGGNCFGSQKINIISLH